MAITKARMLQRGGTYGNFDKTKVLPREFQFVESGDPTTYDGRAIYAGFEAGEPKRLSTYEDMSRDLAGALAEIEEEYLGSITIATQNALSATSQASSAASAANSAAEEANNIIDAFKEAVDGTVISDSQSSGAMTYSSQKIESDFLRKSGNGSDVTVTFQQAAQRAGIQSGDSLATAFGKLAKFCADLQDYVFNPPIANLTSTDATRPLAASMGKQINDDLSDKYDEITSDLKKKYTLELGLELPSNANLNGYKTPNIWYIRNADIAQSCANIPTTTTGGKLIVEHLGNTSNIMQTYKAHNKWTYTRIYNGTEWSTWEKSNMSLGNFTGNIDNLKTPGWYRCTFTNITNGPYTSGYGWLEVIAPSTTAVVQKVYRYNTSGITQVVMRGYTNAQWYPWRTLQTVEFTPT